MKAVIQRVHSASVSVADKTIAAIDEGLVVFLGVEKDDAQRDAQVITDKIKHLRIFEDAYGKMNYSVKEKDAWILVVSQFTLAANLNSGRRPSLSNAAVEPLARSLYEAVIDLFKKDSIKVAQGQFGSHMEVSLVNDGPVTFILDSKHHS